MVGRLTAAATRRAIPYAAAVVTMVAAWSWLAGADWHTPHAHGASLRSYLWSLVMWQAMVVAMMTPTVLPWVAMYAKLVAPPGAVTAPWPATASFAGGYFTVWLAYSAVGALLQLALQSSGLLGDDALPRAWGGAVLVTAGLLQFLPLKQACLSHCRNPLSYFLARWRNGPTGGFRLGLTHGAYCVGCCWALMATGFALGLMNLAWMAVLTVALAVEQTAPHGARAGQVLGVGLVLWGIALLT